MKKDVGLWIDHRKAVIVGLAHDEEDIKHLQSNLEKQVLFSGVSSQDSADEERLYRQFARPLKLYFDEVVASLRDAESIQIFGPGDTKVQLQKRLEREAMAGLIVGIETVEKMSERQIEARVWQQVLSIG